MTDLFTFVPPPAVPRWEHNLKRDSLDLVIDGKCEAYLIPWEDKKTGEHCGWSGVLVGPDGQEVEYSTSEMFWTPLEKAKSEIYDAVVGS